MGKIYFISDAHLGSLAIPHRRMQERRLVNFLESIRKEAEVIYLLGDMFDFWYEYRTVVPKGYTRFLGKLSELTDQGIEVHFFTGNHDLWIYDYLNEECGIILHKEPQTVEHMGKLFFLAHGDGLGDPDKNFKLLRSIFHNDVLRQLFSCIHPRWSMALGLNWAKHSRLKRIEHPEPDYMGEDKEYLVCYAKEYLRQHGNVNYFIFGHRHIMLDLMLSSTARVTILGDWITQFSYAVFDGETFLLDQFTEGEEESH